MATQDLTHLKPGDKIAIKTNQAPGHAPRISHRVYTVTRLTPTQIEASNSLKGWEHNLIGVRRKDGKVIKADYERAIEATPELLAQHDAEVSERMRWQAARDALGSLLGKELHQLKLTTPQLERLAAAWAEVKAMGTKEAA